jgi:hypothetical protein
MKSKTYGLQQETRTYLRRLYAYGRELRGEDINDIDEFIKGLKVLGLWGNTVCWPMRSIHNIGTGSTVLSLGGISNTASDGTIMGSVTWGATGLDVTGLNSTTSYIATKLLDTTDNISLFSTSLLRNQYLINIGARPVNPNIAQQGGFTLYTAAAPLQSSFVAWGLGAVNNNEKRITTSAKNIFQNFYVSFQRITQPTTVINNGFNKGSISTASSTTNSCQRSYNPYVFFRESPNDTSDGSDGIIALNLICKKLMSKSEFDMLHDLSKTTIAKNLGLP